MLPIKNHSVIRRHSPWVKWQTAILFSCVIFKSNLLGIVHFSPVKYDISHTYQFSLRFIARILLPVELLSKTFVKVFCQINGFISSGDAWSILLENSPRDWLNDERTAGEHHRSLETEGKGRRFAAGGLFSYLIHTAFNFRTQKTLEEFLFWNMEIKRVKEILTIS